MCNYFRIQNTFPLYTICILFFSIFFTSILPAIVWPTLATVLVPFGNVTIEIGLEGFHMIPVIVIRGGFTSSFGFLTTFFLFTGFLFTTGFGLTL